MIIKTKYDIHDTIYYLYNNKLIKSYVECIKIKVSEDQQPEVWYISAETFLPLKEDEIINENISD